MEKKLTLKAHKVWVDGEGYGLLNKAYGLGAGFYAVTQLIGKFDLPVMGMMSAARFEELTGEPITVLSESRGAFGYEFKVSAEGWERLFPASSGNTETEKRPRTIRLHHNVVQFDVFIHGVMSLEEAHEIAACYGRNATGWERIEWQLADVDFEGNLPYHRLYLELQGKKLIKVEKPLLLL